MAGGGGSAEPGLRHERSRISGILLWSQLVEPLQELSVALHTVAHPCHPRPRAARAAHSRIEPSRAEWSLSCCHLFELIDRELEVVVHHLRADRSTNRRLIAAARTAKQCDTAELAAEPHAQCDVENHDVVEVSIESHRKLQKGFRCRKAKAEGDTAREPSGPRPSLCPAPRTKTCCDPSVIGDSCASTPF